MNARKMTVSGRVDLVEFAQAYLYLTNRFPDAKLKSRSAIICAMTTLLSEKWKEDTKHTALTSAQAYGILEQWGLITEDSDDVQDTFLSALQSEEGMSVLADFDAPGSAIPAAAKDMYEALNVKNRENLMSIIRTNQLGEEAITEFIASTLQFQDSPPEGDVD